MIWWLAFEKKPFQFWREIWIQVVVILLQLYFCSVLYDRSLTIGWNTFDDAKAKSKFYFQTLLVVRLRSVDKFKSQIIVEPQMFSKGLHLKK